MKKHALRIIIGLLLTLVFLLDAAGIVDLRFVRRLEALTYDLRLNLTMPGSRDSRVVIIDIDEKSLAEEGRWPWSRDRLALLMDKLFDRYKVAVVGFDVVFAEKDESSGIKVIERLATAELKDNGSYRELLPELRKSLDYDSMFADRLKERQVVMGYYFTGGDRTGGHVSGLLPPAVFTAEAFRGKNIPFVTMTGYGSNLPELQKNALGAGHFNPYIDPDGVCRRLPILIEHKGSYYESLSVAVVRALFGHPPITPVFPKSGGDAYGKIELLQISDLKIPVDERVCALIPYRGVQGSFRYISMTDVLHGRLPANELEGAIALVGTSALGLMEHRSTPVSAVFPGVEIHANMIAGILDQNIKKKPAYTMAAEIATLVVAGFLLSLTLPLLSPLKSILVTFGTLAAVIGLNVFAWQTHMVLPLASSLLLIAAIYIFDTSYGFFVESRAKRRITGLFGQYVPPELVQEMSGNPDKFTTEGESREMTVLFSDVRDFTTISEGLDPKQLSSMMNEYMTAMTRTIHRHRGTIDKYIGDAIMAFWGAPLSDPAHTRNAVLAALEMQAAVAELRPGFLVRGWPELKIGIALNTGVMNVGNMGSEFRMAYTVMGDAVNLCSRLEGLTKHYGVEIIVGEAVRRVMPDMVFRELDRVRVKGKAQTNTIYEPLGLAGSVDEKVIEEVGVFEDALRHYRSMEWNEAELLLTRLAAGSPECVLYRVYLERIRYFRGTCPIPNWDGVFPFRMDYAA